MTTTNRATLRDLAIKVAEGKATLRQHLDTLTNEALTTTHLDDAETASAAAGDLNTALAYLDAAHAAVCRAAASLPKE